jgi:hypothetical protein
MSCRSCGGFPEGSPEPGRAELIRYFTLAPANEAFLRKFRGRDNTQIGGVVSSVAYGSVSMILTGPPQPREPIEADRDILDNCCRSGIK